MAELVGGQNEEIFKTVRKTDWAKNMTKAMNQVQMMIKEKGIDALMDYINLDLDEDDDPLS